MTPDRFLSKAKVNEMSGLSDVTRWRMEKRSEFPNRRQISPNRVAYLESEVLDWMESRPRSGITRDKDQGGSA
jgi:predicted DNA-binding transcriptional regulator AlpA